MSPVLEIIRVGHASPVAAIPTAAGPQRLLDEGLERWLEDVGYEVRVTQVGDGRHGEANPVAASFRVADAVGLRVRKSLAEGALPVVLSGSCHAALGSVSALPGARRGIVWLDCHGDFNTADTTTSGLVDGTVLASLTGRGWSALCASVTGFAPVPDGAVVLAGARDLDSGEERLLGGSGVARLSRTELRHRGSEVMAALGRLVDAVYLHLDLDVLDPSVGVANAYARPGGLTSTELQRVVRMVARETPARVVGLASYDPEVDESGAACRAGLDALRAFAQARLGRD